MYKFILFPLTGIAIVLMFGVSSTILFGFTQESLYAINHGLSKGDLSIITESFADFEWSANPQSYGAIILIIATIGALIRLFMVESVTRAKTSARIITEPTNYAERRLLQTVERMSKLVRIRPPRIAIFLSSDPNSYSVGASKHTAMIGLSNAMFKQLSVAELEAVVSHEIAHIANNDMVTLGLLQGMTYPFIFSIPHLSGHLIDRYIFKNEKGRGISYFVFLLISQLIFGLLPTIIIMWFSRRREYRADSTAMRLVGKKTMIATLERLRALQSLKNGMPDSLLAFGLRRDRWKLWRCMFAIQPTFEKRIARLNNKRERLLT